VPVYAAAVNVLRSATVTLPDGTRHKNARVLVDGQVKVFDRRTHVLLWEAEVLDVTEVSAKRWTVDTEGGTVDVRKGCGCGR
jgi:hypothetical protein